MSIGSGKLVPSLAHGTTWPYTILGVLFAALGAACTGYAFWRHREVERAISRGEFARPDERLVAVLAIAGTLIGIALVVVLLAEA